MRFGDFHYFIASLAIFGCVFLSHARDAWGGVEAFDPADVRLLDSPFKQAMQRNAAYLLELEPDRFLHYFKTQAGLAAKAPAYSGWESPDEGAGRCLGHYLSALSSQYRATADARFLQRIDYIVDQLAQVQTANGNGYLGAEAQGKAFWAELEAGDGEALKKHRVPWYIQHKMFAGLRDAYQLAGCEPAKSVLVRLADWAISATARLNEAAFQSMLEQEHGGMREVLCDVYAITHDQKYLALAGRFYHHRVIDPLMAGEDHLAGLHANTQIPKVIGEARWYEVTGETSHREAAKFFWQAVVHSHTYANGGSSDDERFDPPGQPANHLGLTTSETCNTYNMLKLSDHLFRWEPRVEYADYVERALFNHLLASVGPKPGNFTYYVPMKTGHFATFSQPKQSFWCCVGTGMENQTKYGQQIFYHDGNVVYVNQFIPCELVWNKLKVEMEADYPESGRIRLIISGEIPSSFVIKFRYPSWAGSGLTLSVNKVPLPLSWIEDSRPGSFLTVNRRWSSGDELEVNIPMCLRCEALPDDPHRVAVFFGPMLLCGQLGSLDPSTQLLEDDPHSGGKDEEVPDLQVDAQDPRKWIVPAGQGMHFRTTRAGLGNDLDLVPFYQRGSRRYVVYWKIASSAGH